MKNLIRMMKRPVCIKIGGSLLPYAGEIIRTIRQVGPNALIIPGGGIFADTVRELNPPEDVAHFMAIAAMDQYGWYLSSFGFPVVRSPRHIGNPAILLPYQHLLKSDPLPKTWDVTSDTISAYFASLLQVPLILLKSVPGIRSGDKVLEEVFGPVETEDLDPLFLEYVKVHGISGWVIDGSDREALIGVLNGKKVKGTRFG